MTPCRHDGNVVRMNSKAATKALAKVERGHYRHASGLEIKKSPAKRIGRNGFALAGWAILRGGREVGRWSTLERAAREAGKL